MHHDNGVHVPVYVFYCLLNCSFVTDEEFIDLHLFLVIALDVFLKKREKTRISVNL